MTNMDSECDPFSVIKTIQALVIKEITQVENEKKSIPFDCYVFIYIVFVLISMYY